MSYRFVRFIINLLSKLFFRMSVVGMENVPKSGAFVAASNHLGRWDVAIVYQLLDRDDIILLVAEKYRKSAFWRWLVRQLNAVFIDRYNADFQTLRVVLSRLKKGGVLVIAPEGTRSPTGALIEGHHGGSYLAAKAGVEIVPVALTGSEDKSVIASFKRLQRPQLVVRIGEPFRLPPLDTRNRDAALQSDTDEIMCRIAALLPPQYRGAYAGHPRLQELLRTS